MLELIGHLFVIIYIYLYIFSVLFCTTSGVEMTRFTSKNIVAQQFCCHFWILQWITMQVIPSPSVFLLACLLLFLCVSVSFWERLAFSHVLPLILSRKRFRFWNWKTSCMHIVAHSLEGLNTSRRICIFQHILIQYLGAHLRLRLPSRLSRGWGRLVDLRWHCSLILTICDVSLQ